MLHRRDMTAAARAGANDGEEMDRMSIPILKVSPATKAARES
jgi:hypothetical protein